jgi:hypothetical protein
MLLDGFSRFYIPSSHYATCLWPHGIHPLLDPLWSTHSLELVHDACQVTRFRKCELVSRQPITYEHLRVCDQNPPQAYNCCQCEKCVRNMIYLQALDRLDKFSSFPLSLDLSKYYSSHLTPLDIIDFYQPVYHYLQDTGKHPELLKYLEPMLFPPPGPECSDNYRKLRKSLKHCIRNYVGSMLGRQRTVKPLASRAGATRERT